MRYFIRFFFITPLDSVAPLHVRLSEFGYSVQPAGTNTVDIVLYGDTLLRIELTTADEAVTQDDVLAFIEVVHELPDEPDAPLVLETLAKTQAVLALHVPEDADPDDLDPILDECAALGKGLVQVDGEGFYQDGVLILALE
ncbi:MAG: hypothetical protein GYB65_02270 [Chloroflexi bacterium]|nr:hypothetical protein [Chloroflexota bacterium]